MKSLFRSFLIAMALWGLAFAGGYWSISSLPAQSPPVEIAQGNILGNNLLVLLVTLSGVVTAGLAAILEMLMNGFFVGAMTKSLVLSGFTVSQVAGMSWMHAGPELAGFWLAAGIGLDGVWLAWNFLLGRKTEFPVRRFVIGTGGAILLVVVAALIEVNISLPRALQQYTRQDGRVSCEQGHERGGNGVADRSTMDCGAVEQHSMAQ